MKSVTDQEILATAQAVAQTNNQREAAAQLGVNQSVVSRHMRMGAERGILTPKLGGDLEGLRAHALSLPRKGKIARHYFSCMQNYTKVNPDLLRGMFALAERDDAQIHMSTFQYDKTALGQNKLWKRHLKENEDPLKTYPKELVPFIDDRRVDITPNLSWCGETQVSPTARRPLSGFETYTYRRSTIVPHTTIAMTSVGSLKGEGTKLLYTTGCATMRNYIQRKEGFRAEHFHAYGFLLVEVDDQGNWYPRHVTLGPDGAMYDMDRRAYKGKVSTGHRAEDITWGDVHSRRVDKKVAAASWRDPGNMLDALRPKSQHAHDILDFNGKSHWNERDPHARYEMHVTGNEYVPDELKVTADVANELRRPWSKVYVVNSNHDRWLERWLKETDWRDDMLNAETILELNLRKLQAIRARQDNKEFFLVEHALRLKGVKDDVAFLREDQGHVILEDYDGGIECGMHGDRGVNGAKGTVAGFARMGRKINIADKHSVSYQDHVACAGTSSERDLGYNKGPGSWSAGHIVTYPNGTRAIYVLWKGKWRA